MSMNQENRTPRSKGIQTITMLVLLVIAVSIVVILQTRDDPANMTGQPLLGRGAQAPGFTLPDLEGKMVGLTDQKGKVVFLNIWATWCPPCVQEMPSMEKLHQALKDEDFKIIAVSIDNNGTDAVRPFMRKHKLNFTALIDEKESLKIKYQTTGVPETFIIDKKGTIVEKIIGPRNWAAPEAIDFLRNLARQN